MSPAGRVVGVGAFRGVLRCGRPRGLLRRNLLGRPRGRRRRRRGRRRVLRRRSATLGRTDGVGLLGCLATATVAVVALLLGPLTGVLGLQAVGRTRGQGGVPRAGLLGRRTADLLLALRGGRRLLLRRVARGDDDVRDPEQVVAVDEDAGVAVDDADDLALLHLSRDQGDPDLARARRAVREVLHGSVLQTAGVDEARRLANDPHVVRRIVAHQQGGTLARLLVADVGPEDLDHAHLSEVRVLGARPALDVRPVEAGLLLALVDTLDVPVEVVVLDAVHQGLPVLQCRAEPDGEGGRSQRVVRGVGRRVVGSLVHEWNDLLLATVLHCCGLAGAGRSVRLGGCRGGRVGCGRLAGRGLGVVAPLEQKSGTTHSNDEHNDHAAESDASVHAPLLGVGPTRVVTCRHWSISFPHEGNRSSREPFSSTAAPLW